MVPGNELAAGFVCAGVGPLMVELQGRRPNEADN